MTLNEWIINNKPLNSFINCDCMEGMGQFPDNYFDLAIVDPPYGVGGHKQRVFDDGKRWDVKPNSNYFSELKRVSKNQIVWGGNYFKELWPCKGYIIWDKRQPNGLTFAMVELATCTFDIPAKMFFTKPAGERGFYTVDEKRIHPTQKPIRLYRWLLVNYAKKDNKILDTHVGSGSSLIACEREGFDYVGFEIDPDYCQAAMERIKRERQQLTLALQ